MSRVESSESSRVKGFLSVRRPRTIHDDAAPLASRREVRYEDTPLDLSSFALRTTSISILPNMSNDGPSPYLPRMLRSIRLGSVAISVRRAEKTFAPPRAVSPVPTQNMRLVSQQLAAPCRLQEGEAAAQVVQMSMLCKADGVRRRGDGDRYLCVYHVCPRKGEWGDCSAKY